MSNTLMYLIFPYRTPLPLSRVLQRSLYRNLRDLDRIRLCIRLELGLPICLSRIVDLLGTQGPNPSV